MVDKVLFDKQHVHVTQDKSSPSLSLFSHCFNMLYVNICVVLGNIQFHRGVNLSDLLNLSPPLVKCLHVLI